MEREPMPTHSWIAPINGLISDLLNLPEEFGACVDVSIHSTNRTLFLEKSAMDFDMFLRAWSKCLETTVDSPDPPNKRTLMIRVKAHPIEEACLELLEKHGIVDYFFEGSSFLDVFDIRSSTPDRAKFAYRISEYEGIEDLLRNPELYDWLFVDSLMGGNLLTPALYNWAIQQGMHICVGSPALQNFPYNPAFFQALNQYPKVTLLSPAW